MRHDFHIAQRLYNATEENPKKRRSRPAVRVALSGIIIGVVVMILTIFIVVGFKQTIREEVAGFGAHIQVVNFDNNNTYELRPIAINDSLLHQISTVDGVVETMPFATKPGMIKTNDAFQAIVLKGRKTEEERQRTKDFFAQHLVQGQMPSKRNEVIISSELSRLLQLDVDSTFLCYFIQDQIRARRFIISGIYNTDFLEYDRLFIVGDITQVQQLNGWDSTQVSGIEVYVDDFDNLEEITNRVYFRTANKEDANGDFLYTQNIYQLNPMIFSWLDLLDMNVVIIIILMLCVSGVCICSGLIILILEGIQFIGVIKALGATNQLVRRIYLWQAAFLIGKGMLLGNIIGLALGVLQYFFHLIPLDPTAYYVSYVPIAFSWGWWIVLNIGTFLVSMFILLAPSTIITRISPAQVMHFE